MSRPTLIGIAGRSYPDSNGIKQTCEGCRHPFIGAPMRFPGCRRCLVLGPEQGFRSERKREAKAARRAKLNKRAAKLNPAWK